MAMLAEPRQRKRYNLVPKGKALYEDDGRFGTKMLEKMGWKKGEGLGANSEGSKDFVRIRYKNDAFGLGFEQRDDQWTQHEQSFNGLLKTLNNEENDEKLNNENDGNNELDNEVSSRVGFGFQESVAKEKTSKLQKMKEKISGISLEERSKQSKARVHYKKFTKGKDLAQYSEKDLANIFGKKAVDEHQEANDLYRHLNNTFGIIQENPGNGETVSDSLAETEEVQSKKKDKKNKKKDLFREVEAESELQEEQQQKIKPQTFNSNISVQDYFKMKMDAIRNKKAALNNEKEVIEVCQESELELPKKKKKSKKEFKDQESIKKETEKSQCTPNAESFCSKEIEKDDDLEKKRNVEEQAEFNLDERKTKKKKNKDKYEIQTDSTNEVSLKKKRKLERLPAENSKIAESVDLILEVDLTQEPIKKKKKKNKKELKEIDEIIYITNDVNDESVLTENQIIIEEKKKKDKSKKIKELTEETSVDPIKELNKDESVLTEKQLIVEEKKKKDKSKKIKEPTEETSVDPVKELNKDESVLAEKQLIVEEKKEEDKSQNEEDLNFQELSLEELKEKYHASNVFPISSYCAEKFRNINLNKFEGSSLPQIEGYGLNSDLKLNVTVIENDEERIANLWKFTLHKYNPSVKPEQAYKQYFTAAIEGRKRNGKTPKVPVKHLKRRNVFQLV